MSRRLFFLLLFLEYFPRGFFLLCSHLFIIFCTEVGMSPVFSINVILPGTWYLVGVIVQQFFAGGRTADAQ